MRATASGLCQPPRRPPTAEDDRGRWRNSRGGVGQGHGRRTRVAGGRRPPSARRRLGADRSSGGRVARHLMGRGPVARHRRADPGAGRDRGAAAASRPPGAALGRTGHRDGEREFARHDVLSTQLLAAVAEEIARRRRRTFRWCRTCRTLNRSEHMEDRAECMSRAADYRGVRYRCGSTRRPSHGGPSTTTPSGARCGARSPCGCSTATSSAGCAVRRLRSCA